MHRVKDFLWSEAIVGMVRNHSTIPIIKNKTSKNCARVQGEFPETKIYDQRYKNYSGVSHS